jgi:hypothetical protein
MFKWIGWNCRRPGSGVFANEQSIFVGYKATRMKRYLLAVKALYLVPDVPPVRYPHLMRGLGGRR